MKVLTYLIIAVALLPSTLGVRIEEVYYDPLKTESGGEAIVLYNPSNKTIDLNGYVIKTENSDKDAVLKGKIKDYFLVTDRGWNESRDNQYWNYADYEEPISLGNVDSGIALIKNGTIIDQVGWGDVEGIDDDMYEGTPAPDIEKGHSLLRISDTNDNSVDFIKSTPMLKSSKNKVNAIKFFVNTFEVIMDDDLEQYGNQIIPYPGTKRKINVVVKANSGKELYIDDVKMNETYPGVYKGYFYVNYYEIGNKVKQIEDYNLYYEVMPLTAIDVDSDFFNLDADKEIIGDQNFSTKENPTIKNIGNQNIDIALWKDFNSEIMFSLGSGYQSLGKEPFLTELNLAPQDMNELSFKVFVQNKTEGYVFVAGMSS